MGTAWGRASETEGLVDVRSGQVRVYVNPLTEEAYVAIEPGALASDILACFATANAYGWESVPNDPDMIEDREDGTVVHWLQLINPWATTEDPSEELVA